MNKIRMLYFKHLLCFLLISLCLSPAFSQQLSSDIVIGGKIKTSDNGYAKFKVLVYDKEKHIIAQTYSDSSRNYILIIPRNLLSSKELKFESQCLIDEEKYIAPPKNSYCGTPNSYVEYFNGFRTISVGQFDSIDYLRADISASKICYELRFPSVEFKENKIEMVEVDSYHESPDSVVRCLSEMLKSNPKFVIELSAHADSKEENPEAIASFRGEMIKNMLMCLDINPKRLIVKSYGCKRLLVTEDEISKCLTEDEKNIGRQRNRRVVFSVLRKDFKE